MHYCPPTESRGRLLHQRLGLLLSANPKNDASGTARKPGRLTGPRRAPRLVKGPRTPSAPSSVAGFLCDSPWFMKA
jgi:hypothetical protein